MNPWEDPRIVYERRRTKITFLFNDQDGQLEIHAPTGISEEYLLGLARDKQDVLEQLRIEGEARRQKIQEYATKRIYTEGGWFPLLGIDYEIRFSHRILVFDNAFIVPRGNEQAVRKSLESIYRCEANRIISQKVKMLAERFQINYTQVKINGAEGRWGSCTIRGNLNFSWRLILFPESNVDYVICHELAHRKELNHSPRFWAEVQRMCPDYQEQKTFMRDNYLIYSI